MFFSVVVPTHNRKNSLLQLLESLSQQTLDKKFFEVIAIASPMDPSLELIHSNSKWPFSFSISTMENDKFNGKSASAKRNFGVRKARYPWIAFIDDDCVASPLWLETAKKEIEKNSPNMVEGGVSIPKSEKITLTYKGLLRLTRSGGYQTCNMFYNKRDFLEAGGFDPHFPFYLEDTDLAWTMLEKGKKTIYCPEALVHHPVPPPQPRRLLDQAVRMEKLAYLYKKHPETYKKSSMRALPRFYFLALLLTFFFLTSFSVSYFLVLIFLGLRILLTLIYLWRLFRGCSFTFSEISQTFYYLLICPEISLFYLIRGNWHHSVFLFLR